MSDDADFTGYVKIASLINLVTSSLSFSSTAFFIVMYFKCSELQTFSLRLYCWMFFSDMMASLAYFLTPETLTGTALSSGWRCEASAILLIVGQISSSIWSALVSHAIYSAIVKGHINQKSVEIKYLICAYGGSMLILAMQLIHFTFPFTFSNFILLDSPLGLNRLGPDDFYCWMMEVEDDIRWNWNRFGIFYVPIWLMLLVQIVYFFKVNSFEKRIAEGNHLKHKTHRKFFFYVLIYVCTWLAPTIEVVASNFGLQEKHGVGLSYLAIASTRLHGFVISLLNIFNKRVRRVIANIIRSRQMSVQGGGGFEMQDLKKKPSQKSIYKPEVKVRTSDRPDELEDVDDEHGQEGNELRDRDLSFLSIEM